MLMLMVFAPVLPMERIDPGEVVPRPMYPLERTERSVLVAVPAVEEPMAKTVESACEA